MGYWFSFTRSKQRSMVEESTICVPRRQPDWSACVEDASRRPIDYDPASLLDLYYEQLMLDFGCQREDLKGSFFKGCHGKDGRRFTHVNVGKNCLGYFGVEIATELLLPYPETFTGHCWRRSAGTNASNAGVNVTTLMSMMGWSCPKTAMEYVKHSRVTSLQMSMYLCNVQRQNVAIPFPSNASDRRRKTVFPAVRSSSTKRERRTEVFSQEEEDEPELFTQGLLQATENVETKESSVELFHAPEIVYKKDFAAESVTSVKTVSSSSSKDAEKIASSSVVEGEKKTDSPINVSNSVVVQPSDSVFAAVDQNLSGILQNLQNHGNVHIHFHFDKK